jgi:hypothetical protein
MKKVLLTLLALVLILGALGAAGFAGFQFGYRQGVMAAAGGNAQVLPGGRNFGPQGMMPGRNFNFDREFGGRGFGMMNRGMGFGFLSPFLFLARIAFWALVIWAVYMLVTRSGWRLTRTVQTQTTTAQPASTETEIKEETRSEN